jgi:hypothetical protein
MEIDGYDLEAPFEGFPVLTELAGSFTARVRSDGAQIRGLRTWRPTRRGSPSTGRIGRRHLASGRPLVPAARRGLHRGGSARFEVRSSREGDLLERWEARAGSVTLMRAPGLAGVRDGRPYHAVHGPPRGTRCSLALRMRVDPPGR